MHINEASVRVTTTTDGQTGGQAQSRRDNVLFSSLLIGLSVDFFAMVALARECGVCAHVCMHESMRAFVCVIVKML